MAISVNAAAWPSAIPTVPATYPIEHQLRVLVRYAALAPSNRNSQPWRFAVDGATVLLRADLTRWQRVSDPDRRDLHASLGCALENLLTAADCAGYRHAVSYFPDARDREIAAAVTFTPGPRLSAVRDVTFQTLQARYTEQRPFVARVVAPELIQRLRAIPGEPGVRLQLSDDAGLRREVDVLNVRAMGTLFGDGQYRQEFAQAMGQGNVLAVPAVSLARRLANQDSHALLSAPLVGIIGTLADTPADQLRSGRLLERLWLVATSLGLALQPLNQAIQVPALREALALRFPEAGCHPQQLVRIGYAASRPAQPTPRRALEDVLLSRK